MLRPESTTPLPAPPSFIPPSFIKESHARRDLNPTTPKVIVFVTPPTIGGHAPSKSESAGRFQKGIKRIAISMSTEDERKLFVAGLPDSMTEDVLLMPPAGFRL